MRWWINFSVFGKTREDTKPIKHVRMSIDLTPWQFDYLIAGHQCVVRCLGVQLLKPTQLALAPVNLRACTTQHSEASSQEVEIKLKWVELIFNIDYI